jgi:NCS2 family nucleobase:cation symporter-2
MTKVVNRFCVATGAAVLVLAGLFPKIGALFSIMPSSVLGGAVLTVFAMITINGIKLIARAGFSQGNLTILSITLGLGYAVALNKGLTAKFPPFIRDTIYHDTTIAVCVIGVLSNLVFGERAKKETAAI